MRWKCLAGMIFGGAITWAINVVYKSNKNTRQIIKRGKELSKETEELIEVAEIDLSKCDPRFQDFAKRCYAKKYPDTLEGSIQMARDAGVPEKEILHSIDEVDNFFLAKES